MKIIVGHKIKRIVQPAFKFINIINRFLPKKPNRIVLYSNLGFRDNVKAIYDYLLENKYNQKYEIICSVNDYKKYNFKKSDNVKFVNNFFGVYYFLNSKYFFYSFGKYPIKPSSYQIVVNLWHGTPLKKIGNLEPGKENIDYNFFTYILATSDYFGEVMKNAFNCDDNQILICGHPRNDYLFKESTTSEMKLNKTIVWLPTFRSSKLINEDNSTNGRDIPIFDSHSKMSKLNRILSEQNVNIIIKLHPIQNELKGYKEYSNIQIWSEEDLQKREVNLYELLADSEALITDYSSVYFDYLLLDRPIGFTIEDLELYSSGRGLLFENPEKYMPGKKISTEKQFYEFIFDVVKGNDEFNKNRIEINNFANHYKDNLNCNRVLELVGINKIIKERR